MLECGCTQATMCVRVEPCEITEHVMPSSLAMTACMNSSTLSEQCRWPRHGIDGGASKERQPCGACKPV